MVVKAIRALNLNDVTVYLGIGVNATNATVFDVDLQAAFALLSSPDYSPLVAGVIIGNEYVLTNKPSAESYATIKSRIDTVAAKLRPLSPSLLVGGADTIANLDGQLRDGNAVWANIHPWSAELCRNAADSSGGPARPEQRRQRTCSARSSPRSPTLSAPATSPLSSERRAGRSARAPWSTRTARLPMRLSSTVRAWSLALS